MSIAVVIGIDPGRIGFRPSSAVVKWGGAYAPRLLRPNPLPWGEAGLLLARLYPDAQTGVLLRLPDLQRLFGGQAEHLYRLCACEPESVVY